MAPRSPAGLTRRVFLKVAGAAGAGLAIGVYFPGCIGPARVLVPELYVRIGTDGRVTVTAFRSEMGQGIRTAIAMIVADELDAAWSTVDIEQADADPRYGDQVTSSSRSVSGSWDTLRRAGATARRMLIEAAARRWNVDPSGCSTEPGVVVHPGGARRLTYADLAGEAAVWAMPDPHAVALKSPDRFRIVGTARGHWDAPAMVTGRAVYGIDVRLPGMLFAAVARCPVFGGRVAGFDASAAETVDGVRRVVGIDAGVAVVAGHTWAALRGREALRIRWDEGANAGLSSSGIRETLARRAPPPETPTPGTLSGVYAIPYEAHAAMEPMNCVADVRPDRCEVWAPTQNPQKAKRIAVSLTGLPEDAVRVHVTLMGGGFGRRLQSDFVAEAVQVSRAVEAPVQVVWTREDDIRHGVYHPMSLHLVRGPIDAPEKREEHAFSADDPIPTGAWRSVRDFPEAFARESFLDEVAAASGRDPVELRLAVHPEAAKDVLRRVAAESGWGSPLPPGHGRGVAYHAFGDTRVATVAEVSVGGDGAVRVRRVTCAVDCGRVVNPDTATAQIEGGVVFALTAALKAEIVLENGRVRQGNFDDCPMLRMDETPRIDVFLLDRDAPPTGLGEAGVPPTAPAVANAVFAATGRRVRRLPIRLSDVTDGPRH